MTSNFSCVLCNNQPFDTYANWNHHVWEHHGNPFVPKTLAQENRRYSACYRIASETLSRMETRRKQGISVGAAPISPPSSDSETGSERKYAEDKPTPSKLAHKRFTLRSGCYDDLPSPPLRILSRLSITQNPGPLSLPPPAALGSPTDSFLDILTQPSSPVLPNDQQVVNASPVPAAPILPAPQDRLVPQRECLESSLASNKSHPYSPSPLPRILSKDPPGPVMLLPPAALGSPTSSFLAPITLPSSSVLPNDQQVVNVPPAPAAPVPPAQQHRPVSALELLRKGSDKKA